MKVKKAAATRGERNANTKAGVAKRKAGKVAKKKSRTTNKRVTTRKGEAPAERMVGTAKKAGGRPRKSGKIAKARRSTAKKMAGRARAGTKRMLAVRTADSARFVVKALDPLRKCGPSTTVQLLYRVDVSEGDRRTAHLVYFDRHGWYCEHGRACPAVGYARKHKGQIARAS